MKRRRSHCLAADPAWLARVRELRAAGATYQAIADAVHASITTVWEALNPDVAERRAERRRAMALAWRRNHGIGSRRPAKPRPPEPTPAPSPLRDEIAAARARHLARKRTA